MEDPGLFLVFAVHLPDREQAAVRNALLDEVARVRRQLVTAEELDKAKNQLATQYIHGLETVDGVATQLGQARYVERDWRRFLDEATRYLAVTAADVRRVAEAYLTDDNLTLVSVRPK
jgi:zinc protease